MTYVSVNHGSGNVRYSLHMTDDETMGQRITKAMSMRNISQAKLAQICRVSRMTVHQWVKDTSEPRPENLLTLAHVLGTDARYLVFGDNREPRGGFPAVPDSTENNSHSRTLRRRKT